MTAGQGTPDQDAPRRTMLAGERTELAWVRTGLTALAVAVGVGQIAPELGDRSDKVPFAVLGIGFAVVVLGLGTIAVVAMA